MTPTTIQNTTLLTGWLAPTGDFYPCPVTEHTEMSVQLGEQFGLRGRYTDLCHDLSDHGWLHIGENGAVDFGLANHGWGTQAQLDVLYDVLRRFQERHLPDEHLRFAVESFEVR
jgi:hypothetical protein